VTTAPFQNASKAKDSSKNAATNKPSSAPIYHPTASPKENDSGKSKSSKGSNSKGNNISGSRHYN